MRPSTQIMHLVERSAWILLKPSTTASTSIVSTRHFNSLPRRRLAIQSKPRIDESPSESQKPKLIIFDKDGTLICFHSMWIPWAVDTAKRLEQATGTPLSHQIYQLLGLCPSQRKVLPGLLAEGTMAQIKHEIRRLLVRNGFGSAREFDVLEKCIQDSQLRSSANLRAIHDMQLLFTTLKENNIKIAVCTADNRINTTSMLRCFGVEDLVDIAVCGDDPGSKPKPNPHNANFICKTLGVEPENTVMVGDTLADLGMARAAGLGAAVGVLSGVGAVDHLKSHADILVPHVGSLLTIFLGINEFSKHS